MKTIAGQELKTTVSVRVEISVYERFIKLAQQMGKSRLSDVLRPALIKGLEIMEAENENQHINDIGESNYGS